MRRHLLGVLVCLAAAPAAPAAVVAVGNFTGREVTFSVAEPGRPPQTLKLPAYQVIPVTVAGPADLSYSVRGGKKVFRIDVYNGYGFIPDPTDGLRLEGIELPGDPPPQDDKPEPNFTPPAVLKIPVTLLLDAADPRADANWQPDARERLAEASAVIETACGVRFEFAGFARWRPDPAARDVPGLLASFEDAVKVKPGQLTVGWTGQKVEEKDDAPAPFGACRGLPTGHVLIREGRLIDKGERTEVLIHYLATALGAVPIADPGSVMRPTLGDGKARLRGFTLRFDPLNVLVMNLWADELRRGPLASPAQASVANRTRLIRVYGAIRKATPGNALALGYLNDLDRAIGREPLARPEPKPEPKKEPVGPPALRKEATAADLDAAHVVVRAVVARARANTGPNRLAGDDLTAAYVRAAAEEALKFDDVSQRVFGFLVGLAVALGEAPMLIEDPDARAERLKVLGNPTLRGRQDLRQKFAAGCGAAAAGGLTEEQAADLPVQRFVADLDAPGGAGFPGLVADLSGAAFARAVRTDPSLIGRLRERFVADEFLAPTAGLRDGYSRPRFIEDYGSTTDRRFQTVVDDLRQRVKKLPPPAK
jgi:hypothetical protein